MGLLVNGEWKDQWYDTKSTGGRFIRKDSQFRDWVTPNGEAGPEGQKGVPAEKGRYHLYISLACPWASRVYMVRQLKGLEDFIGLSIVNPIMLENGWTFADDEGVIKDPVMDADYLHQIYTRSDSDYSGRVTVPVLYDLKEDRIINNESSDIIRMLNTAFDDLGAKEGHFYPEALREEIDAMNDLTYDNINNGVYKAGFATDQAVYEEEMTNVFAHLAKIEEILEGKDYLVGDQFTEADIRLFTTLVRFDSVYYGHFKCNLHHLWDYENLWRYTRQIYHMPGVKDTVNFHHIKTHYYGSHPTINANLIVPKGPEIDWSL